MKAGALWHPARCIRLVLTLIMTVGWRAGVSASQDFQARHPRRSGMSFHTLARLNFGPGCRCESGEESDATTGHRPLAEKPTGGFCLSGSFAGRGATRTRARDAGHPLNNTHTRRTALLAYLDTRWNDSRVLQYGIVTLRPDWTGIPFAERLRGMCKGGITTAGPCMPCMLCMLCLFRRVCFLYALPAS